LNFSEKIKPIELEQEQEIYERLKLIFDATPLAIEYWDKNHNPIDCNQTALDLYGFSTKKEYIENLIEATTFIHSDGTSSWDIWKKHLEEIFHIGFSSFEYVEQNVNGDIAFAKVDGIRMQYNDDFVVITYSIDITQLKEKELAIAQAQTALKYREKLLHTVNRAAEVLLTANEEDTMAALLEGMEIVGNCLDVDRVQIWINEVIDEELYFVMKYEWLSEIGKQKIEVPIGLKAAYSSRPGWLEMFLRGDYINGPISQLTPEDAAFLGHYEMISILILPLFLNKEFIGFFSIDDCEWERTFTDDEMDMFASAGMMFTSVFNRTVQNEKIAETNKQLEGALKQVLMAEMAEESNKAKSRFLARMSHEIRTPITAVLGISEIQLQNPSLPVQIEESFAKIHNSASLLLGIINDILDLSKIEAGKMELHQEEYDVASMISDVTHLNLMYLSNKDVKFHLHVDENLPSYLTGDVIRIEQIVNNLLSNAFKYTETGTIELSLRCHKDEAKEDYLTMVISICDTGFGMNEKQLNALYDDYARFHEQKNHIIGGTGLGMPIVYNLAQLMDAKIDLKSEVGKGTNVVVHIPQKIAGSELLGKEATLRLQQFEESIGTYAERFKFAPTSMPYGNVLVVDDVETNLYVAQGLLKFYDLNIEVCDSGYEAINKIKQGKVYDIVFMDHMMPGLNGTETMQALRDIGYEKPIIVLTANALIGQAEEFIKSGFDGFISKPIQTKHLNAALNKYIRRDSQPLEVSSSNIQKNINSYLNGDDLKTKLCSDFAKSQKNVISDIRQALNTGDTKAAHLLAHTLKGVAGLINENALVQAAEKMEHLLDVGGKPMSQLEILEHELTHVFKNIEVPESTICNSTKVLDRDKALMLFDLLNPLLKSHSAECINYLEQLKTIPETAVLVRQIERFDFADALKTLDALKAIFGE